MISKDNVKEEHIEEAYKLLKEYCLENKHDLIDFVSNKENIKNASTHIHKKLNFALRLLIKPAKIESMINENHEWIVEKTKTMAAKDGNNSKNKC